MPKVDIQTETGVEASISIIGGESKKNPGKYWKAIKVKVGDFEQLIFCKPLELRYVQEQLGTDE